MLPSKKILVKISGGYDMTDSIWQKPGVLAIAEKPELSQLQSFLLDSHGIDMIGVDDCQSGLEVWSEKQKLIRIVLTALPMPVVDGFEVIKTIRAQESLPTLIIALCPADNRDSMHKALKLGADDYITTPLYEEEVSLRLSAALQKLRLFDHLDLVQGLAEVTAERSGESGAHLLRVKHYCALLADDMRLQNPQLGLTVQLVNDIAHLSVLHDIGKNGIPDGLLNKRGSLTTKEYEIIKDHTTIGGAILKRLAQQTQSMFLIMGHEIALYHHERWDGNGYPYGLRGEEIPLAGRIMAFADVFDALLSRRPYKDPFSVGHAELYIEAENGRHFDPAVVESYKRNRDSFMGIHNAFPDTDSGW